MSATHRAAATSWNVCLLLVTFLIAALLPVTTAQSKGAKGANYDFGSEAIVPLRAHTIYAPYVESSLQNRFWDFGGDAIVDTNRHIRLTQDRPHQKGWLWSRLPITAPSFEINFEFRVDGKAHTTFGDGFAVWLTEERAQPGPVFGSKDYFTGLGVFFDTFANARHPYSFPRIMAMMGNGNEGYRSSKDGANQELGACSLDIRKTKVASRAKLTFVSGLFLELKIHSKEWDLWETCFKLENVRLPQNPYLGFTSLTGDVSDAHDIISVSSNQIVFNPKSYAELEAERKKHFPTDGSKQNTAGSDFYQGGGSKNAPYRSTHGVIKGFFGGLFSIFKFVIKWGFILALLAGVVYLGLKWQKARDAKRF
ncbi:unnamed protein product [Sympodiomycopsis kandeliae]